jgi:uncharacterized protein
MPSVSARSAPELNVSVKRLSRRPGESMELVIDLPAPPDLGTELIAVPPGDQLQVLLLAESVLEGVLVTGSARAVALGQCARCLEETRLEVDTTFQELFVYPERASGNAEAGPDGDQDQPEVIEDHLDLNAAVRDAIVLSLPFQPLCREDCPGLCASCGVRLEDNPGHGHRQVDPRWAVLEDLLEDDKEGS